MGMEPQSDTQPPLVELMQRANERTELLGRVRARLFRIEDRLAGDISRTQNEESHSGDRRGTLGDLLHCAQKDEMLIEEIEGILTRVEGLLGVPEPANETPEALRSEIPGDLPNGLQQTQGG